MAGPIRRRAHSRTGLLAGLRTQLDVSEEHDTVRREAETLAAYQTRVPAGTSRVELPNLYEQDSTLAIELDPALPVSHQIEKRFKLAAKLERSRVSLIRRIAAVESEIAGLDRALSEAAGALASSGFDQAVARLQRAIAEHKLARQKRPAARRNDEPHHRRFELDPLWFAIVGRSNRENDEITFHVAAPSDMWLHAQQVPGSHVILKSRGAPGNPPARILEMAAAIAAYFSKAKHSSVVPVIYTQRKYVRKPRGAPAGTVVCDREKTVFVEPSLPPTKDAGPA